MDRQGLIEVLEELDRQLPSPCEILLVGGAAMILHFGADRATQDVDALVLRGESTDLREAVRAVAARHNLREDWLSDAVKGFAGILPPDFHLRLTPLDLPLTQLRLYALGRAEQVAMKIVALREQDLEDLGLLLPRLSPPDRGVLIRIIHHVATFRPDWAQKIRYFLEEQGWRID